MEKNISSLPNLILNKELKAILASINPEFNQISDLSRIFTLLFREGKISEQEYKIYRTRYSFLRFTSQIEQKFQDVSYAIYLYDNSDHTCWNASTNSIAAELNTYTHGLRIELFKELRDIIKNKDVNYIVIPNIYNDNKILLAEHKHYLLKYGYLSAFVGILRQNGNMIGLTNLLFKEYKNFSQEEIVLFQKYNRFVEGSLIEINNQLNESI